MIPHPEDTIVAVSSATGPGGRAIVRITGLRTREVVSQLIHGGWQSASVQHVSLRLSGVAPQLPAMILWKPGPATVTGQDLAELHIISSPPLVDRLLADLLTYGARSAERGEFTLRSFLAGKKDLPQAEAILAVIDSRTEDDLQQSLTQLAGGLSTPLQDFRSDLLNLLADVEAGLDFVDEDIEFVSTTDVLLRVTRGMALLTNLRRQLDTRSQSSEAFRVVLVGPPNAGKSSLFNALLQSEAAIVSPVAGTTRDFLSARLELGGTAVELIDTAGLDDARDDIESQAQSLGTSQREQADLIVVCIPPEGMPTVNFPSNIPQLSVRTKADLLPNISDDLSVHTQSSAGLAPFREKLVETIERLARPLAPSQSRCRAHLDAAMLALRRVHEHARENDPQELLALALREALEEVGKMAGTVYTNDLLDRIFSRFCIGK
jgi:tRNA modification GTPase